MAKEHETPESGKKKPNRVLPIILGIVLVAGIIFGIKEYIYYGKHVDTDDAQIDGDISPVVARVGGYVDSILFQENTHVNKGQLLVKIDDRDYRVKLEQALTARTGGSDSLTLAERQPRRIVFDALARLPLTARLLQDLAASPLTVVVSRAAPRAATDALEARGVDVICATGENEPARVRSALAQLGSAGVTSMLLEGGPRLAGAFMDAGAIDELRLFVAPVVMGGRGARDPIESEGTDTVADAVRALSFTHASVGADLLLTARLREW